MLQKLNVSPTRATKLPPLVSGAGPILGHAREFLSNPDELLARGLKEHGRVFSLRLPGRRAIVLLGPDHAKFLFNETDKSQRLSIRKAYPFFFHMFSKDGYFLAEPDEYHRQRDIVLPRFQSRQMEHYVAVMEGAVREFIDQLDDEGEFDLIQALGPLVMRIAANCFLGAEFSQRMAGYFDVFRRFSDGLDPLLPGWVPAPHLVRSHKARDQLRAAIGEAVQERRERPIEPPDFLQELVKARYADGEPLPDSLIITLALMLVWIGHETTAGHLAWGLIDLLKNPAELDRVSHEREALGIDLDTPLTPKHLHRLAHLDRAMHESERLHPLTNGLVRRAVENIEHAGYWIPKGSVVFVHPGLSHRLPDVFPDPDAYRPDRFLEDPESMRHLVGFGGGLHRCLGTHFTYLELKVTITRLFQHFELELIDTNPRPMPGQKNNWPQSPCRIRYRRKA